MKKLISIGIAGVAVLMAAVLALVGYRHGWFHRPALRPSATSSGEVNPAGGVGGGAGASAQSAAMVGSYKPPAFDGNVAALDAGGHVETATGLDTDSDAQIRDLNDLIDGNKETVWKSTNDPGPKDIVVSFLDQETVLIDRVVVIVDSNNIDGEVPRDVEVWVSNTGPKGAFTRVASASLPPAAENIVRFDPVEARSVKFRVLHTQNGNERVEIAELQVMEASRSGYTPLFSRRPDLQPQLGGSEGGAAVAAAGATPACVPLPPAPATAGHGESKRVLVLLPPGHTADEEYYHGIYLKKHPEKRHESADLAILDRIDFTVADSLLARPWLLSPKFGYDTVILEQVCEGEGPEPSMRQALMAWVAAGHKLTIHDADKCSPGPDYAWLPYHFKTDNPGAHGAKGDTLRFVEQNWMAHGHKSRPGFIDADAWETGSNDYYNELGDSNTVTEWDPHWCGHMMVRNASNVFGFVLTYAHFGRGLVIYSGFDIDQHNTTGYDLLIGRELAQGFDPDNLPCSAHIGDFVVTTETRLMERPFQPGRSYDYPLTLLSNQGYKGTVALSIKSSPGLEGMQASFVPASVALDGLAETKLSVSLPANAPFTPQALEVKGTDAAGKSNSVCLQLVQPQTGELNVINTLARPAATSKNLEIILDASGSMKTALGKKTRWATAHDVLEQVLATLPSDFNVGLRIYGHRESSLSPKTCTDSELAVPIQKLDQQAILNAADAAKPRGETPLVYSVLQSPADLKELGGGTVIVITDGEESCHGDPVKAAAQLKASGLNITLNIVGFTTGQTVQQQLSGFAQATGGRFYAANDGPTLAQAIRMAAVERFPYRILDAGGKELASGEAGQGPEELPPGDYTVVVTVGEESLKAEHVHVALAGQTTVRIATTNGQVVLQQ